LFLFSYYLGLTTKCD